MKRHMLERLSMHKKAYETLAPCVPIVRSVVEDNHATSLAVVNELTPITTL